jgi:glutamine amidotransferase
MIAVVDYDMGNLRSVQKGLQQAGGEAQIVRTAEQIARADKIVFPGQGAFRDAIVRLREHGLADAVVDAWKSGKYFLGICIGMQLLFERSYEDGMHEGLGVFEGEVKKFEFQDPGPKRAVPHMGWNQLDWEGRVPLFDGLEPGEYVYFCHSYHVVPARPEQMTVATCDYGYPFAAALWKDNLFATQFHPEKSQGVGLKILENFVRL